MNKKERLERRIIERSSNPSTAEQYGFKEVLEISDLESNKLVVIPICKKCFGKKTITPMFFEVDCLACYATGIDLSDPLAVIRLQQSFLEKAKEIIGFQRKSIYDLAYTDEEKQALTQEKFYKHAKRFD